MQSPPPTARRGVRRALLVCLGLSVLLAVFPVASGFAVVMSEADARAARWWQGGAMVASVVPLAIYGWVAGRTRRAWGVRGLRAWGVRGLRAGSAASVLYFVPLLVAKIGFLLFGVETDAAALASMGFMALAVGVAEELYFRGAILTRLSEVMSLQGAIWASTAFFALVHVAQAFAGTDPLMVALSVVNAFLFGWVSAELVVITESVVPMIVWHAAFDFINWVSLAGGRPEVVLTAFQSVVLVAYGVYLWRRTPRDASGCGRGLAGVGAE